MVLGKKLKIITRIIQVLLATVMLTPVVFYHYFFFPFVTSKMFVFRILIFLALLLFGIYVYLAKKIKYYISPLWRMYLVLIGVCLLSALFGVSFLKSFWSNIERADGILMMLFLGLYLLLLTVFFKKGVEWRWLFRVSLFSSLIVVGYGFLQYFGLMSAISSTGERISSTIGNPAYLGSYALINLFLAIYLVSKDSNLYWRIFDIISISLNFFILFLTQTRGAVVGLGAGLFVFLVLNLFRLKNRKVKATSLILLILIILSSSLLFAFKDSKIIQANSTLRRVASISLDSYTVKTRLLAWEASFTAFKDRPVLGWGPENYGYAFSKYFPPEIYVDSGSRIWFDKAHSVLFEYLVTGGILGVLAYFGLLAMVLYYLFKSKRLAIFSANVFISLIVGYTVANLFVFDTLSTYILFMAVLGFTANIALPTGKRQREINFNSYKLVVLSLVAVLFGYFMYVTNVQAIKTNKDLLFASVLSRENEVKQAYNYYIKAVESSHNFTRPEITRELAVFVRNQAKSLPDYEAAPMFDRAILEMKKTIEIDGEEIRHYYNLSQLYLNSYRYDISRLDKLIALEPVMVRLAPTRAHTYYQLGEAYVLEKDYENALRNFNKAVDLNPKVIDAYVNVYAVALLSGNKELEQDTRQKMEQIESGFFEQEQVLLRYLPMFKQAGRDDLLLEALEKLISMRPEKIEYISSLAIYYAEKGENKQAEEVIRRLKGINEQLDLQVEDFINKLYNGEFLDDRD